MWLRQSDTSSGSNVSLLQLYYVEPPATDLASIRCPAHVWVGALDTTTPPAMARHYVAAIPGAQLHELEAEAHLSLPFRHNDAIVGSAAAL